MSDHLEHCEAQNKILRTLLALAHEKLIKRERELHDLRGLVETLFALIETSSERDAWEAKYNKLIGREE